MSNTTSSYPPSNDDSFSAEREKFFREWAIDGKPGQTIRAVTAAWDVAEAIHNAKVSKLEAEIAELKRKYENDM